MANITTQREQLTDVTGTAALRIMRFLPVTIPMALRIEPTVSPVGGKRGGRLTVGGAIRAGGFGARLTYRRVERGTSLPLEETSIEQIALLHDRSLTIQPQALDWAKSGHPPDLWIQYVDGGGSPLTPRTHLGRCDQGPFDLTSDLPLNLFVDAIVLKGETFDLNPLTDLSFSGDISIRSGIAARLTMSRSRPSGALPIEPEAAADGPLIPRDTVIHLPRRPLRSPLGRDLDLLAFLDGVARAGARGPWVGGRSLVSPRYKTVRHNDATDIPAH
jgi:hypothetical protein